MKKIDNICRLFPSFCGRRVRLTSLPSVSRLPIKYESHNAPQPYGLSRHITWIALIYTSPINNSVVLPHCTTYDKSIVFLTFY
jgi:hypothetical protein